MITTRPLPALSPARRVGAATLLVLALAPTVAATPAAYPRVGLTPVADCAATVNNLIINCGFETPPEGANFVYNPPSVGWTFEVFAQDAAGAPSGSGIAGNGSLFTTINGNAPQGQQVAFLQGTGRMSETFYGGRAGVRYGITFSAVERRRVNAGTTTADLQDIAVSLDGRRLGNATFNPSIDRGPDSFTPPSGAYGLLRTVPFILGPGAHTLVFGGLDDAGGDQTALVDNVVLLPVGQAPPVPPAPAAIPLQIAVIPLAPAGSGRIVVIVRTAPHAAVRVTARLSGPGVPAGTVLSAHGVAGPRGRYIAHLHVMSRSTRAAVVLVSVTAMVLSRGQTATAVGRISLILRAHASPVPPLPPAPAPAGACRGACTLGTGSAPSAVAVDAATGRVFVAESGAGTVRVLEAGSGRVLRDVRVGRNPVALTVVPSTGRVFVANASGSDMAVLDARSGALLRVTALNGAPYQSLAVDDAARRVIAISGNNTLDLLDAASGVLRASVSVGTVLTALAVDSTTNEVFAVDQGSNSLSVRDVRTGAALRVVHVSQLPWTVGVDEGRNRAYLAYGGSVSTLNARTGAIIHTATVGQVPEALAVDTVTGRVFVANTTDGTVSVLDASTGAVLRTTRLSGSPKALTIDARRGRVYVVDNDVNTVDALDARTGALVGTHVVAGGPVALAFDLSTGRLFVANRAGNSVSVIDAP